MKFTHEYLRADLMNLARRELDLGADDAIENLSEDLDSMQRLALVVAIEDHYEICFEPEDDAGIAQFDDVVKLVARKLQEQAEHVS